MDERTIKSQSPILPSGVQLNGAFEIERLIAEGGMGQVYKGHNVQTREPVAIKILRRDWSENQDALELFRREAKTMAMVQHDAIVRYHVFMVDPALGRAYLAMEYVEGPSLRSFLLRGPLTPHDVDIIRVRIGRALDYVHKLGVVHRDIAADNFILPNGEVGRIKLIDFGIARARIAGEGTVIGKAFAGKYSYASPEQLAGADVSFKTDIYSFGLVLAEALRGRPLDNYASHAELFDKRLRPPNLSDIPAYFHPLLTAMLQPDPAQRPNSMGEVAEWVLQEERAPSRPAVAPSPEPATDETAPGARRRRQIRPERPEPPPLPVSVLLKPSEPPPQTPVRAPVREAVRPPPPAPVVSTPPLFSTDRRKRLMAFAARAALKSALFVIAVAALAAAGALAKTTASLGALALCLATIAGVSAIPTDRLRGALAAYAAIAVFGLILGLWLAALDRKPFSHLPDYVAAGLALAVAAGFVIQSLSLLIEIGVAEVRK